MKKINIWGQHGYVCMWESGGEDGYELKKKPGSLNGIKRDFSLCNWDNYLRFSIKKCLAKGNRKQNIYDLI